MRPDRYRNPGSFRTSRPVATFVDDLRAFFEAERQRPRWRGLAIITAIACIPFAGNLLLVFVPGSPPAYFDGSALLDLKTGLFAAGFVLSARIWARAVPSVHGEELARGASAVAGVLVVLAAPGVLF